MKLAFLLLAAGLAYGHPHNITRRTPWYSVRKFDVNGRERVVQAWPCPVTPRNLNPPCPVRYCYNDEASYSTLHEIVEDGIKFWKPAMDVSNMVFQPDLGIGTRSMCSDRGVRRDAVRIQLVPGLHGAAACASLGHEPITQTYGDAPLTADQLDDGEGEHYLKFKPSNTQYKCTKPHKPQDPSRPDRSLLYFEAGAYLERLPDAEQRQGGWLLGRDSKDNVGLFPSVSADCDPTGANQKWDVFVMAHELGHVAGLRHEHQRPNAMLQIMYDYTRLSDYDNVKATIDRKDSRHGYVAGDTMTTAWSDLATARRYKHYFPGWQADNLMPLREPDHRGMQPMSPKLDFDSIMMYESYIQDGLWGALKGNSPMLLERRGSDHYLINPGGLRIRSDDSYSLSNIRISEGDIARIAQLYPRRNKPSVALNKDWVDPNE